MIPAEFACIDFETYPIKQRPEYPPKPVGLAVHAPWHDATSYGAFAHPTNNNCTWEDVRAELGRIWDSGVPVLCHHAKFDVEVACHHFKLPMLPWDRIHDTMFLAYLCDPHSKSGGLKDLAADLLQWPPEEKDAMAEWIMSHSAGLLAAHPWNREWDKKEQRFKEPKKITKSKVGAWIFATPGDIAGPYACGDVDRTIGLFRHLAPIVLENGMWPAYNRERELMPILMENERDGMRADVPGLIDASQHYGQAFDKAEEWLRHELRASGLNFDADQDVAETLSRRAIVANDAWQTTKDGSLSMSKDNLRPEMFTGENGAAIASALGYRNRLKTCLSMFINPWLAQAQINGGRITTNWNQVRDPNGGTRTGRPSTDKHNFLNISKDFEGRTDGYLHPDFLGVPNLPLCRKYILPDEGHTFLHRDFDGQEMRVFAHFEQGQLWDAYQADPAIDPHAVVGAELLRLTGKELERTKVKVLNFQAIFGGAAPAAAAKLNCSLKEAKEFKAFHEKGLPGRKILSDEILKIVRAGDPIRTWGGRLYFPEAPRFVKELGRWQSWEYKLINYEVQGSAADLTKQALIEWNRAKNAGCRFLVTVYDEINISAVTEERNRHMALLRSVMEAPRLSVPMRSSGKEGPNWGDLKKCP
jgi:DNA polymerase I-like protein with 3'-5' exonuclease and polymerase domains